MRYRTKLLIAACLLLAMSLSAAAFSYWGVAQSHRYLIRSRIAHEQLERQLQLSRHSQQLFKAWTDTILTGLSDRPLGEAYLKRVIESDLAALEDLSRRELAIVGPEERKAEMAEVERLKAIRHEFQHTLDQLAKVDQLRSRGRPDMAWQNLVTLIKGGIDRDLNGLIEVAVADESAEVLRIDSAASNLLKRLERISTIHAGLATLITLALAFLLIRGLRAPLAGLLHGTRKLAEGDLSYQIDVSGRDEFAELGRSFNSMAADLQHHQKALQNARDNLETIVDERTEELRKANESLRKIDETRRAFFADISHELRTPLTVIRGEGEIALRGRNKRLAEYKQSIERIVEQAKHLSVLVGDLLFIARQGAGAAKLKLREVDITALVYSVVGDAKVIALNKDVGIEFPEETPHETIDGDPVRLRQLLLILLDNAIRYSNGKGTVTVGLARADGTVNISVADTGVGIPEEDLGRVFERFRRAGNAADINEEGLGLGLPVAKAIVEAHKGRIEIKSKAGEGTTVLVSLPEKAEGSRT
ncbi:MAG: HAMP domain-containing protein [Methyloceanibacter sp.]|uniref:sensor histidine kinase n=1 Tax=Methyloceanibacter sp. TaxID=1965321 RepID=UPI001DD1A8DA|nr:ATP-binding protein [Methyloceanibacter sp.]MCB1442220.1 HAMP domain-containing protein [Methyloceanibacter sp.]